MVITLAALASSWPGPPRVNRKQAISTLESGWEASCLTLATLTRLDEAKACLFENAERYACFRAKLLALAELVLPALQLLRGSSPRPARGFLGLRVPPANQRWAGCRVAPWIP